MTFLASNHESLSVMLPIPISESFSLILVGGQRGNWLEGDELSWIEIMLPADSMGIGLKRMDCAVEDGDGAQ